jgi:hypothetical protein
MAKREVAFPGLSGLLAFGAGVAVGANWPRASNFVGFILQRLGFELTDLALWMWDPEKSLAQEAEVTPVKRAKAKRAKTKRAQALVIQDGRPISKSVGVKTSVSPGNPQSGGGVRRVRRRKPADGREPWIRSEGLNGSAPRSNGNSQLVQSSKAGSRNRRRRPETANVSSAQPGRVTIQTARKKTKRTTIKTERKNSSSGHRRKINTFPGVVLPAEAALN